MKYYSKKMKGGYKSTKRDKKWLNAYFASCMNLLNTKLYVDTFFDYELELEKEIKLITDYEEVVKQRDKLLEENTMLLRQKAYGGDFDGLMPLDG